MEFGWINLFGAGIVVLIMIPNIIYAARQKQDETQIEVPHGLSACEQVGRYGCIILMWLPLLVLLLFVLDALLEKKDLISSDGISYHSNRDISSVRPTAPSLALGGICNSFRICSLYDHIHDA